MSFWSILDNLLSRVVPVTDAVRAIGELFKPNTPAKPIPFGRAHAWGVGLEDPPRCAYCAQQRTQQNADAVCPGPPKLPSPPRTPAP